MIYRGFEIEAFEIGRGQWHARFRRLGARLRWLTGSSSNSWTLGLLGHHMMLRWQMRRISSTACNRVL